MGYNNVAEQWTSDSVKVARLFADLADATHPDKDTRLSSLDGQLPCIAHYATKTQLDILRALLVKMTSKTWQGDRMVRVRGGMYRWQFRDWASA